MGEYATIKNTRERVKIGTCEDLMYLRWDQVDLVRGETPIRDALDVYLFRFPWPGEDNIAPGHFDSERAVAVHGVRQPEIEHGMVQFTASAGYVLSIPCPEGQPNVTDGFWTMVGDLRVGRNGFKGAMQITGQRVWEGRLVLVCRCGPCGSTYRLPTLEMAQPVIDAFVAEGDGRDRWDGAGSSGDWYRAVAARIEAGYRLSI